MPIANIKRETAARMIAEDREPDHRIAQRVGVSRRTIEYWKKRRDVRRRVREISEEVSARLKAESDHFDRLWQREVCLFSARGPDSLMKRVAIARLKEMGAS